MNAKISVFADEFGGDPKGNKSYKCLCKCLLFAFLK